MYSLRIMETKEYLIALNMVDGLGSLKIKRLLKAFSHPKEVFIASASDLKRKAGVGEKIVSEIKKILTSKRFKDELTFIKREKTEIITIFDDDYPVNLKAIYEPPILLYVKGKFLKSDAVSVAVVGSRKASLYGRQITEKLSIDLAQYKITVVSGLARGVDTASHIGALRAGGRTISVLGSGLAIVYPPENIKLCQEIAKHGAVISEFPVNTAPYRQNFPRRNRIISGLSLGVVVVEARRYSGSLITADCALEQGREVFAVPGNAGSLNSQGTNHLIRQGAKLVENVDDIIEELKPVLKDYLSLSCAKQSASQENKHESHTPDLEKTEKKIYKVLLNEPLHFDELALKTNINVSELSVPLLSLEVKGMIKKLPGGMFAKCN